MQIPEPLALHDLACMKYIFSFPYSYSSFVGTLKSVPIFEYHETRLAHYCIFFPVASEYVPIKINYDSFPTFFILFPFPIVYVSSFVEIFPFSLSFVFHKLSIISFVEIGVKLFPSPFSIILLPMALIMVP